MSNLNFDRGAMARIKKTAEAKERAKWEKMGERRSLSYPKYEASDYADIPKPVIPKPVIPKPEELKAKSAKPGKLMMRFSVSKDLREVYRDDKLSALDNRGEDPLIVNLGIDGEEIVIAGGDTYIFSPPTDKSIRWVQEVPALPRGKPDPLSATMKQLYEALRVFAPPPMILDKQTGAIESGALWPTIQKLPSQFVEDQIAAIQNFVGQQAAANNNPQSQQAFQGWQSEGPAWGGLRKSGLYGDNSRSSDFEILLQDRVAALELSNRILMETVRTLEETITAKVLKRLGAGPLPDLGEQPTPRVLNPSRKIREI